MKGRFQFRQCFGRGVAARPFVFSKADLAMLLFSFRIQLFDADCDRDRLVRELVTVKGSRGALMSSPVKSPARQMSILWDVLGEPQETSANECQSDRT